MPRTDELGAISARTLDDYNRHAAAFRDATSDHDVRQNLDALLKCIEGTPPFTILDFGCGPGRDLCALKALGHVAIGLDGAPSFVAMARELSGCDVWQQDFLALALPPARIDGIFANASLQHVPRAELPRVLGELRGALKPRGVFFASLPHGHDEEGWIRGRYGAYHDPRTWRACVGGAGFELLDEYYRPAGLPRERQPWLASVWRRTG
jgi:SAM-dependent methyltransferase